MEIGTVKEIKTHENRLGLVPASFQELVQHGHEVVVETTCGAGVGFSDWDYERAGAPGAAAPKVLAKNIIKAVRPGSVVVDIGASSVPPRRSLMKVSLTRRFLMPRQSAG
ncbi:MAG: hypothetical protein VXW49_15475, partial [Pseudomonadota bacterium]|nr:hypothetical protein [Pseudomonadota bacterium]